MLKRIISGGQTGVDRAALRFGLDSGYEIGGYCPEGYTAEDGQIPEPFRSRLTPTRSRSYPARTRQNVEAADATLVIRAGALSPGTALTIRTAGRLRKPLLVVQVDEPGAGGKIRDWLRRLEIDTLNVAGPRESGRPGVGAAAYRLLVEALRPELESRRVQ